MTTKHAGTRGDAMSAERDVPDDGGNDLQDILTPLMGPCVAAIGGGMEGWWKEERKKASAIQQRVRWPIQSALVQPDL